MERNSQSLRRRYVWLGMAAFAIVLADYGALVAQAPGTVVAADKRVKGRDYVFPETGETLPYALFVPSNYDAAKKWPLIVGLHGAGRPYDWLMGYEGMIDFAERDGFILVTPLGYRSLGGFGAPRRTTRRPPPTTLPPGRTADQARALAEEEQTLPANIRELSEKDVMNVFEIVRKELNIDPDRIYLWGHSMGGGGTYHLAAKYPGIWAALAVAAPGPAPERDQLERFRHIPILVLQGEADQTVPAARTRETVAKMKELGMEYVYVELKGGDHSLFISKNRATLSKIFSFFNIVQKSHRAQTN
jgi:dipeptidyl aminopeptidase/acylaminoacyl peptidase